MRALATDRVLCVRACMYLCARMHILFGAVCLLVKNACAGPQPDSASGARLPESLRPVARLLRPPDCQIISRARLPESELEPGLEHFARIKMNPDCQNQQPSPVRDWAPGSTMDPDCQNQGSSPVQVCVSSFGWIFISPVARFKTPVKYSETCALRGTSQIHQRSG